MSASSGRKLADELEEINNELAKVAEEIKSLQKRRYELTERRKNVQFPLIFHI